MQTATLQGSDSLSWLTAFRMDDLAPTLDAQPRAAGLPLQDWLLAIAEQQDQRAFERLYEALAPRVLLLAKRILRNAACAEEVVEDCFWQVWRQAVRFDPERGSAEAWVMTMARSRALDAWRARDRASGDLVSLDLLQEDGQTLAECADDAPGAAELLDAARHHARLHEALQQLKPEPRQLLALAFFRGLTHEEIAEQTGVALGTVKSHIRRALASLHKALALEGGAA
jgi:RNA polymerase sigma-70 factor, ECF subfamily